MRFPILLLVCFAAMLTLAGEAPPAETAATPAPNPPVSSTPAAPSPIPAFSSLPLGTKLPAPFRFIAIPNTRHNLLSFVRDQDATVLKVESNNSAGSAGMSLILDTAATPRLSWRWKVDRVLTTADTETKAGDDYSARVYVFFDVPLESLPFVERTKIRLARVVAGEDVPTAALCYVWDNRHKIGHTQTSPYTQRAHFFVLQSGPEHVGQWMSESRDVAADFRAAFGFEPPRVIGIALGNDTDNTHENVTTWFSDVRFHADKP